MVRIRMKSFGRRHRPFFRICAMDSRTGRDGRAIEELGHYDPMVRNLEARTVLNKSRIRYWLSVGAQPSEKVQAILTRLGVTKPALGEDWKVEEDPIVANLPPTSPTAPRAVAVFSSSSPTSAPKPSPTFAPKPSVEASAATAGPATTPAAPKTAPSDNEIAAGEAPPAPPEPAAEPQP